MRKRYVIITYGCQTNKADSERIASALEKRGYKPASELERADLIVVNMCSVRQPAVDRVYGKIRDFTKLKTKNPKLKTVLTGCVLERDRIKFRKNFDEIWRNKDFLELLPSRQEKNVAYIPISNGCNNFCSYCAVPYTRGPLICRSHKNILKEMSGAVSSGYKEIWLLGQNVNDYACPDDKTINFPKLLTMANKIPGDFSIRFTSPHPKNFSQELIRVMAKCRKVARYLNLPMQSGDDKILKVMRRPYTAKQYKILVKKIRRAMPDINLSTDVIVGFPGETKKQFENTKKLFKELKFNIAYISKYSSRPGTESSKIKDDVPHKEKERRWKILNDIILKK